MRLRRSKVKGASPQQEAPFTYCRVFIFQQPLNIGRKRLINRIFTGSRNYVKEFSKRFEEEFDDTMAGEQG
jgi:hypothetical protein